jgi:hypothetical protein
MKRRRAVGRRLFSAASSEQTARTHISHAGRYTAMPRQDCCHGNSHAAVVFRPAPVGVQWMRLLRQTRRSGSIQADGRRQTDIERDTGAQSLEAQTVHVLSVTVFTFVSDEANGGLAFVLLRLCTYHQPNRISLIVDVECHSPHQLLTPRINLASQRT